MNSVDPDDFVRTQATLRPVALVPALRLFQAERMTPLWTATQAVLARAGIDPPFWTFARGGPLGRPWPGRRWISQRCDRLQC